MPEGLWWLPVLPAIAAAVIDIRSRRLPNGIVMPALLASLAVAFWRGDIGLALAGAALAAAVGLTIRYLARGGFGLGDVKLLTYGGSVVGIGGVTALLLGTAAAGGALGLLYLSRQGRRASVPYGVAITLGLAMALGVARWTAQTT